MKSNKIKRCNTCGRFLSKDDFYKNNKRKDKRGIRCKKCDKNYSLLWKENNRDYCRKYSRQYSKKMNHRLLYKKYRDYYIKYSKLHYQNNKSYHKQQNKKWKNNNPKYASIWQKNNSEKICINTVKYRTLKLNQHDSTTDPKNIIKLYKLSSALSRDFRPYQVDHIIPISKSGSSHENNLQVVTKKQNLEKGNSSNSTLNGVTIQDIHNYTNIFNVIIYGEIF